MKVADDGLFAIYVYSDEVNQRHHLPHCHVRSSNGDIIVDLPTLNILAGKGLSKRAKQTLIDNIDTICDVWNELNPNLKI